jgi:hypothetical protein
MKFSTLVTTLAIYLGASSAYRIPLHRTRIKPLNPVVFETDKQVALLAEIKAHQVPLKVCGLPDFEDDRFSNLDTPGKLGFSNDISAWHTAAAIRWASGYSMAQ